MPDGSPRVARPGRWIKEAEFASIHGLAGRRCATGAIEIGKLVGARDGSGGEVNQRSWRFPSVRPNQEV